MALIISETIELGVHYNVPIMFDKLDIVIIVVVIVVVVVVISVVITINIH